MSISSSAPIPPGCAHAHEDGAYVLGALSPEDRVAFERHLPTCPECAQSVRELAGIPGLLARVPVEIVDPDQPPAPVPDTLLPALVRRVRRNERRRTWVTTGLVGVAAAVAVGAVGFATLDDDPPSAAPTTQSPSGTAPATSPSTPSPTAPPTAPAQAMRPIGTGQITGWISLTPVGWGTRLDLTCSYRTEDLDYGSARGATYTMFVRTRDGSVEQVASWRALPGQTMRLAAATAAERADIVSVEVRTSAGEPVLELT